MPKLVHAADLHLDSPLVGLERYEAAPVAELRRATRDALDRLVELCVTERADLLLIDVDDMDQYPPNEPLFVASSLTLGRDVRDVIIDGKLVMRNREILTVDMAELRARLSKRVPEIMARFDTMVT